MFGFDEEPIWIIKVVVEEVPDVGFIKYFRMVPADAVILWRWASFLRIFYTIGQIFGDIDVIARVIGFGIDDLDGREEGGMLMVMPSDHTKTGIDVQGMAAIFCWDVNRDPFKLRTM